MTAEATTPKIPKGQGHAPSNRLRPRFDRRSAWQSPKGGLHAVPCDLIFFEQESGANRDRPELARALKELRGGDTLVVARLERLGRSLIHLLQIMEDLGDEGYRLQVALVEGFDMRTDEGQLMMQQLGSFAEFERKRITARINSGIAAAKKRGVIFGNPRLKAGDKETIRKIILASG